MGLMYPDIGFVDAAGLLALDSNLKYCQKIQACHSNKFSFRMRSKGQLNYNVRTPSTAAPTATMMPGSIHIAVHLPSVGLTSEALITAGQGQGSGVAWNEERGEVHRFGIHFAFPRGVRFIKAQTAASSVLPVVSL